MIRSIAVMLLLIPGIFAALGIKLMRDALFSEYAPFFMHASVQFLAGLILFAGGLAFVGGYIVYRDRKHHKQSIPSKSQSKQN